MINSFGTRFLSSLEIYFSDYTNRLILFRKWPCCFIFMHIFFNSSIIIKKWTKRSIITVSLFLNDYLSEINNFAGYKQSKNNEISYFFEFHFSDKSIIKVQIHHQNALHWCFDNVFIIQGEMSLVLLCGFFFFIFINHFITWFFVT